MEILAKDPSNIKALLNIGCTKKEKWRRSLSLAKVWLKQQNGMIVVKVEHILSSLRKSLECIRQKLEEVFGGDYTEFTKYNSTPGHLCIVKKDGKVLGYRRRYNPSFVGLL
jgi:hypothetical protein